MHLGASSHGFIHSSYELYVAEFSSRLLSGLPGYQLSSTARLYDGR